MKINFKAPLTDNSQKLKITLIVSINIKFAVFINAALNKQKLNDPLAFLIILISANIDALIFFLKICFSFF